MNIQHRISSLPENLSFSLRFSRSAGLVILTLLLAIAAGAGSFRVYGQEPASYEAERAKAFEMIEAGNLTGALPILEKLSAADPTDTGVMQRLALALIGSIATVKDAQSRAQILLRARALAQKAKDLGDNSQLVETILDRIPADLKPEKEEKRTPASDALMEGEQAFADGEMEKAIAAYEKALKLDPQLYEAPLYMGDAYFKLKQVDKAGQSYARAIAIDPDRETAYRYWGNVLMQSGKMSESRDKFLEAIIADPYNRLPWQFLSGWAQQSKIELGHPRVDTASSVSAEKGKTNISLNMDMLGKDNGSEAWLVYGITRALWVNEKFAKEYPNEKQYRHSLREEVEALNAVADLATANLKEGKLKEQTLDVSLANLLKLKKAGLLEAFVLFAKADAGIAQDYPAYRREHRDKLRQYLVDFVMSGNTK